MENHPLSITVFCRAEYRGEETPYKMVFNERETMVTMIKDRWLSPDHRYFKIVCDDDCEYIIRQDEHQGIWEVYSFKQKEC